MYVQPLCHIRLFCSFYKFLINLKLVFCALKLFMDGAVLAPLTPPANPFSHVCVRRQPCHVTEISQPGGCWGR